MECFEGNDFDHEKYESKFYGDYKIKSKKAILNNNNNNITNEEKSVKNESTSKETSKENQEKATNENNNDNSKISTTANNINNNKKLDVVIENIQVQANNSKNISNIEILASNGVSEKPPLEINAVIANDNKRTFPNFKESYTDTDLRIIKKPKEDHYFSKKQLIFDPFNTDFEELFGFSSFLYQNHNEFMRSYLKNKNNDLCCLDNLSLKKPFKLSNHFYLINLGQFYFSKQEETKHQKTVPEELNGEAFFQINNEILCFGDGFTSYRMYKSFLNQGLLVYYYQSKVFIKEIDLTFYVVLPEDGIEHFHNNDLFFFHTNLNDLMSFIFQKIKDLQISESYFREYRFMQNKKCLFPTVLPGIIYEKILKKCGSNINLKANMEETYAKYFTSNNMTHSLCDSLEPLINQFFDSQLKKNNLPKMHLGDFFFGYNNPKINALVHLVKKNRNFSIMKLPEDLKLVFSNLSPFLKLKQKIPFNDLHDNKIPLPFKILRLYLIF